MERRGEGVLSFCKKVFPSFSPFSSFFFSLVKRAFV